MGKLPHRRAWIGVMFGVLVAPLVPSCAEETAGVTVVQLKSGPAPGYEWFTAVSGSREESHGNYIIECRDGGFLQVGQTGFVPNSARMFVVKVDAQGGLVWKREFGRGGHNLANSALEVDDGYLVVGSLGEDSALLKLDKADGSVLFMRTYDNGGSDALEHIAVIPSSTGQGNGDSGEQLVAVGYTHAGDRTTTFFAEGRGYAVFLEPDGTVTRGLSLNTYMAHAYRVRVHGDGGLLVSGLTEDAQDYSALRMTLQGEVVWNITAGGTRPDHNFGMAIGSDGSIFLTGHTLSGGVANWDTYTVKLDSTGQVVWEQRVGNPRGFDPRFIHDEAWGVQATSDGGALMVAGTGDEYETYSAVIGDENSDVWRVYLVKFASTGRVEWQTTLGGGGGTEWAGEAVSLTADGGAMIAVDNGQFGFLKMGQVTGEN